MKKFKAGQTVYVVTELVDAEWNFVGLDIRKYFITEKDPGPYTNVACRKLINKLPELGYFCTTSRRKAISRLEQYKSVLDLH